MATIIVTALETGRAKVLIVESSGAVRISNRRLVVVSGCNAIWHSVLLIRCHRIFNCLESGICVLPFHFILIAVLSTIPQLGNENDVSIGNVVHDPLGLRIENCWTT